MLNLERPPCDIKVYLVEMRFPKGRVSLTFLPYIADIGYGNYVLTAPGGDKSTPRQTREMKFGSEGRGETPDGSFEDKYEVGGPYSRVKLQKDSLLIH